MFKRVLFLIVSLFVAGFSFAQTWDELNTLGGDALNNGDNDKAVAYFEKAVPVAQKEFGKKHANYATSLNNLGLAYLLAVNYEKAEPLLVEALTLRKKILGETHIDCAYCMDNLADLYRALGQYKKAEQLLIESIAIKKATLGTSNFDYVGGIFSLGKLYMETGEYDKAEPLFIESTVFIKKELGVTHQHYITCLNELSTLYRYLGAYEKAEPLYIELISIKKTLFGESSTEYAGSVLGLGVTYMELGQYEKAEPLFLEATAVFKRTLGEAHPYYATSLGELAILYVAMVQYEKAESLFIELVSIKKTEYGTSHEKYAKSTMDLADLYLTIGQYKKAEPLYLESMVIIKNALGETNQGYANCLGNLGTLYRYLGQYEKAESLYIEAMNIIKKTLGETHKEYAISLGNLATLYCSLGQYEKAESLYIESIGIFKQLYGVNHQEYALSIANLASLYVTMGKYEKAEPLFIQSISILKNTIGESHPDYAVIINNLASLYMVTGQHEKAEPLYLESAAIIKKIMGEFHQEYAIRLYNLAIFYTRFGQYEKSEPYFMEAIGIYKKTVGESHPDYSVILNSLGIVYDKMGNYSKAEAILEEAKNFKLQNMNLCFGFLSENEKEKYVSKISNDFEGYQSFYYRYAKQKPTISASAFDVQLVTKGMILIAEGQIQQNILSTGDVTLVKLNDDWKSYKMSISQQYSMPITNRSPDLKNWEEEANRIEKELTKSSSTFANNQKNIQLKWTDIQQQLKSDDAAVEFVSFNYYDHEFSTDSIIYAALIIRKQDIVPIYIPLFEEKQLRGLFKADSLRTFANLLYSNAQIRTEEHDISYGDSLYQLVWKPMEIYLKDIKKIYYSPSGMLHNITFDAIPANETMVLSDKFSLHRLTTTGKVMQKDDGNFSPSSIALFGGIQYDIDTTLLKSLASKNKGNDQKDNSLASSRSLEDSQDRGGTWSYLAGAKKEVQNISDLLNKNKITTTIYTDEFGTEEVVKNLENKNSPSILHFSTHGFFFPDPIEKKGNLNEKMLDNENVFKSSNNPLFRSGLIFAGANYVWKGGKPMTGVDDGILTAYEVSNLYLPNTKLVVMSACETGLGDIKGSEGVYGLQRAFKIAGVEYIIMTLWKVLDKETSDFMTLFYQNLLEKKSIPDAFRATQDVMKNKYRDEPYKWAGFVLIK